jgi:hypothetical protein
MQDTLFNDTGKLGQERSDGAVQIGRWTAPASRHREAGSPGSGPSAQIDLSPELLKNVGLGEGLKGVVSARRRRRSCPSRLEHSVQGTLTSIDVDIPNDRADPLIP